MNRQTLTPKQTVEYLDRAIVGQGAAKRSVAVALRNRYRRMQLPADIREEIIPKNILMIGPTGVGKTEIARRIAKLVNAPFVKVEATKFTEVGYVGRDVESMVRDLVEASIRLVREEKQTEMKDRARQLAEESLVRALVPAQKKQKSTSNPLEALFGAAQGSELEVETEDIRTKRAAVRAQLQSGELESARVTIELTEQQASLFDAMPGAGMEAMGNMQEALGSLLPRKKKTRTLTVREARPLLEQEEAANLIDQDELKQLAIERAEQTGIIFIDEIDKVAAKGGNAGADVSREGVQRDILPIVEGSTVTTKHGAVKTDYMLFIAAGAFHMSKPSDLIPELQGRFPVRVELEKLTAADFERILKEPEQSLIRQYTALLAVEGVDVSFSEEAIAKIAEIAYEVNQSTDNIGARRLHTILERILEELSFEAADIGPSQIEITPAYIESKLGDIVRNRDLSQFIL